MEWAFEAFPKQRPNKISYQKCFYISDLYIDLQFMITGVWVRGISIQPSSTLHQLHQLTFGQFPSISNTWPLHRCRFQVPLLRPWAKTSRSQPGSALAQHVRHSRSEEMCNLNLEEVTPALFWFSLLSYTCHIAFYWLVIVYMLYMILIQFSMYQIRKCYQMRIYLSIHVLCCFGCNRLPSRFQQLQGFDLWNMWGPSLLYHGSHMDSGKYMVL